MNVWIKLASILLVASLATAHNELDLSLYPAHMPIPETSVWGEGEQNSKRASITCDFIGFGCSNPVPVVTNPNDDT